MARLLQPDPGYDWRCQRCKHQWRSKKPNMPPPTQCAKCRSAYWQIPKGAVKSNAPDPAPELVSTPVLLPPPHLRTHVTVVQTVDDQVKTHSTLMNWGNEEEHHELEHSETHEAGEDVQDISAPAEPDTRDSEDVG